MAAFSVGTIAQADRPLRITTPLGEDALIPTSMRGEEEVSRPFLFTVDCVSATLASIPPGDLLHKEVTLHIDLAEGTRHVHGLVRRFVELGGDKGASSSTPRFAARYRLEIVPALWFLSLSGDCRTFEDKNVKEIVETVCKGAGVTALKDRLVGTLQRLPYVAQYRESNLDFVSRLLEDEGIYYMFEHAESAHTLVFADAISTSIPAGLMDEVEIDSTYVGDVPQPDTIYEFTREYAMHSAKVDLLDHDLLRANSSGNTASSGPGAFGERFEFIGDLGPDDSLEWSKRAVEAVEAGHDLMRGTSNCGALAAGTRVTVKGGALGDSGLPLHLLRVEHEYTSRDPLAGGESTKAAYRNRFTAIPASRQYRPPRVAPRPSVRGTQTAMIVGTGGAGEIDVDKNGCVLVEFPWDRGAGKGGGSKNRVHVASVWAGGKWGFVQHPRIGQEVLVEFLEGNPDRPLVTGRVYNSANQFPYALPANKTQSGWKSRTLKGGDGNFNELRFEDKQGAEHVSLQAERDLQVLVKNDETRKVQRDRKTTIEHNDTRTVSKGDDTHTVERGKQTITVDADQTVQIRRGNRKVTLDNGNDTLEVKMGNLTVGVKMGNVAVKADLGKISVEAMQKIELKVGQNTITVDQTGITLKGIMVKVEGQAMVEAKAPMVKLQADAMMQVKGAITQVNGDGMLMAKGGITMIN